MKEFYMEYTTEMLVSMYQNTYDDEILAEIMRRNQGLIRKWAYCYSSIPQYEEEDLIAEAQVACWKAVKNYNHSRGFTFVTCLKGYVRQAFNRIYISQTREKRYSGLEPASYEELVSICCESFSLDDYTTTEITEFLSTLTGTTKQVADLFLIGLSKGDVARALGITPASTTYHIKKLQQAYTSYRMVV